jgi:hypothetical protein
VVARIKGGYAMSREPLDAMIVIFLFAIANVLLTRFFC